MIKKPFTNSAFHYFLYIFWTKYVVTVFPHIIAAATILFWIHLVRKLFKLSFPLCNKNLNSFLTRWGNYSREETIWGNTVHLSLVNTTHFFNSKIEAADIFFKNFCSGWLLENIEFQYWLTVDVRKFWIVTNHVASGPLTWSRKQKTPPGFRTLWISCRLFSTLFTEHRTKVSITASNDSSGNWLRSSANPCKKNNQIRL